MRTPGVAEASIVSDNRVDAVARSFAWVVDRGALEVSSHGSGRTRMRWASLARIAEDDLCVARLAEAHLDATNILEELRGPACPRGSRWGVWAARPPAPRLTARALGDGWVLDGVKPWCSGARACTHALVTADAPDGYRLFAVDLARAMPRPGTWHALGMGGSDSLDVGFVDLPAVAVGGPDAYLDRPGFWHGGIAVAACWFGGAVGLARALVEAGHGLGPHALAHLGSVDAALSGLAATFETAAGAVDADPMDRERQAEGRALRLRAQTEQTALDVADRVGRALGAGPLCRQARHAALAADLPVFLRQSHAEADLERLGALVVAGGTSW